MKNFITLMLLIFGMVFSGLFFARLNGNLANPLWINLAMFVVLPTVLVGLALSALLKRFVLPKGQDLAMPQPQTPWLRKSISDTLILLMIYEIGSVLFWVGLTLLGTYGEKATFVDTIESGFAVFMLYAVVTHISGVVPIAAIVVFSFIALFRYVRSKK